MKRPRTPARDHPCPAVGFARMHGGSPVQTAIAGGAAGVQRAAPVNFKEAKRPVKQSQPGDAYSKADGGNCITMRPSMPLRSSRRFQPECTAG